MRILAIDQGTTSTKALVVDGDGAIIGRAEVSLEVRLVGSDGVEQPAKALWSSVVQAGQEALEEAGGSIDAIGLANQGETVLAWDPGTGEPMGDAISWQDRRATEVTDELASSAGSIRDRTGLPLDPYFAAPKMAWLRRHVTGEGVVTTTDSWLIHRLTGAFVTDASTASRTGLMDLDAVAWSPEAQSIFGLEQESLPSIVPSAGVVGTTTAFGPPTPVAGICVDQGAALFGQGCHDTGDAKCTYGTGAFLLVNVGHDLPPSGGSLTRSIAWKIDSISTYCLDGQVFAVGAAFDWLRRLGLLSGDDLEAALSRAAPTSGAVFVPALGGLGAPAWAPRAAGAFLGLHLADSREDLVTAVAEGIVATIASLAGVMEVEANTSLADLRVDGGVTGARTMMQAQADLLQRPVAVHPSVDATALGIAALARIGMGDPDGGLALTRRGGPSATYTPRISAQEAERRIARMRAATEAVLAFAAA